MNQIQFFEYLKFIQKLHKLSANMMNEHIYAQLMELKSALQESQCKLPMRASIAHSLIPTESVSSKREKSFVANIDTVDTFDPSTDSGFVTSLRALKDVQAKSEVDMVGELTKMNPETRGQEPIANVLMKMGRGKESIMSQVYQKAFHLRAQAGGKYRDQAYVLEEMAKDMLKLRQDGPNEMLILRPQQLDYTRSISGRPERSLEQNQDKIEKATNIDNVVQFLVLMSGQATIFDTHKRQDSLSDFGKAYLAKTLLKYEDSHDVLTNQVKENQHPNLFTPGCRQHPEEEPGLFHGKFETNATGFFTVYNQQSFHNPGLQRSMQILDRAEVAQKRLVDQRLGRLESRGAFQDSEMAAMLGRDISLVNRFNAPLHSIKEEERVTMEQDILPSGGAAAPQSMTQMPKEQCLSAFQKSQVKDQESSFNMTFEIPPLPSIPQSFLIDPSDSRRGEKLVTKTFFSFGRNDADDASPGFLSIKERKVAAFAQGPDGQFEPTSKPSAFSQNIQSQDKKRSWKQAHKSLQKMKDKTETSEQQRKKLLITLFPYVDESKIKSNLKDESGILNLWEDEHLDYKMNKLMVNETALMTPQKVFSFQQQLSKFQNSIMEAKDTAKSAESIVTEAELVGKSLLLLQGIPSSGVFDLNQETFTFSMNGNCRVYMQANSQSPKLSVNSELFDDMMEAGSYFLHLKEFVECMQNAENGKNENSYVGRILQAFSLSVANFLSFYQSQVIDFQNQSQKRRLFEAQMLFSGQNTSKTCTTSILECKIHLAQLLSQLKLLATICFTQKFIDNITEVNNLNKEQQLQEQQEEGFQKFQELLYGRNEKFTVKNLQIEFQKNLEKIRNKQWLEEFPRGASLLTYLYKILMCCESDLQAVDLLRSIFRSSIKPLLQMISEFIYSGNFNDPFNEFFVEKIFKQGKGKKKGSSNDFIYKLSADQCRIPSFLGANMAMAIFKVGSHVHLLQMINLRGDSRQSNLAIKTMEKIEHIDKQEYYNICNASNTAPSSSADATAGVKVCSENIHHLISDEICLELKFNIKELKNDLSTRHNQFLEQISQLSNIEQAIIQSEQKQFQDIIQTKQELAEKFNQKREAKLREQRRLLQAQQAAEMNIIQQSIAEAQRRNDQEKEDKRLQAELEQLQKEEVEQVKKAIAQELKKQYLELIQGENQVLGDVRDQDVKNQEKLNQDLDQIIFQAEERRRRIQEEIDREQEALAQEDVEMDDEQEPKEKAQRAEDKNDTLAFIEQIFSKPLYNKTMQQIHELEVSSQKKREYTLKKQEMDIKRAVQQKSLNREHMDTEVRSRLSEIISGYTNEQEKVQIENEDAIEDERIHVPVHLAINQCVISTVKDQFKVVNRCMLHMMYRKLNLLRHLKALKVFYLSGQGDIMETFAQQLFHSNQECTLKDNSLYFFNNCFEFALKLLEQDQEEAQASPNDLLFTNNYTLAQNMEFEYIEKESMNDTLMLNLHNLENHLKLNYRRTYPLDLVITEQSLVKYNRIFFTLLKVKKILQLLKECWKNLNATEFKRVDRKYAKQVRAMQLLRSSMHSFTCTFEQYIMIDAIDAGWSTFNKKIRSIQVFEDLISIHNEYLDKILDKSMLGRKETKIAQFISQIFVGIQKFCSLVNEYQFGILESYTATQDFETLRDQFHEHTRFFKKFVQQLSLKGHYSELHVRLEVVDGV